MNTSIAVKSLLGVAALALPLMASAESSVSAGAAVTAHVDFQINIPKILYLRVGTGSSYSTGVLANANGAANIDLITFSPSANQVGTGTVIPGVGGDLAGGIETAAVVSTVGGITLSATESAAGISDGAGNFIPFTQIAVTQPTAPITTGYTVLTSPVLNATGGSTNVALPGKVVTADGQWKFSYTNSVSAPGGTYGGVANTGRVTYTLTSP